MTHVTEDCGPDARDQLVNVMVRQGEGEPVFSGFSQNDAKESVAKFWNSSASRWNGTRPDSGRVLLAMAAS